MAVTQETILTALRQVKDPDLHLDIVTLRFVKDIEIDGGVVKFKVELTTPACPVKDQLRAECEQAVAAIPGVESVSIEMTARVIERPVTGQDLIPGVKQAIAIASGKGGVGKSTVTVNLAVALARTGASVGLLDADVYGPSIPLMMGCEDEKPLTLNQKIVPISRYGIKMMSLGFLLDGQAVLWRGPMVAGTVRQLLADVDWGNLDYLLVDLPPGTGDAPMSLAQLVPLAGVLVVATPQHIAANIAMKAIQLFEKLDTPILGVVENMGDYACPSCGTVSRIFAGDAGSRLSNDLKIPLLGSIPLDPAIGVSSDSGTPAILSHPASPYAAAFESLAGQLAARVSILAQEMRSTPVA